MKIVRLQIGKQADIDQDCVRLEEQRDGTWRLSASGLCFGDGAESVTVIDGPRFGTLAEAEEAGLAWAASVGVTELVVGYGTVEQPLEDLEIDKPL